MHPWLFRGTSFARASRLPDTFPRAWHAAEMFYFYFEARHNQSDAPLLIWLTGTPAPRKNRLKGGGTIFGRWIITIMSRFGSRRL